MRHEQSLDHVEAGNENYRCVREPWGRNESWQLFGKDPAARIAFMCMCRQWYVDERMAWQLRGWVHGAADLSHDHVELEADTVLELIKHIVQILAVLDALMHDDDIEVALFARGEIDRLRATSSPRLFALATNISTARSSDDCLVDLFGADEG